MLCHNIYHFFILNFAEHNLVSLFEVILMQSMAKSNIKKEDMFYSPLDVVLIADDDEALQQLLKIKFEKYADKFKAVFAFDGAEALSIMETTKISVLVTDIKMPKVNGLTLLAQMGRLHPEAPCIVITSLPGSVMKRSIADDVFFLEKPFQPDSLAKIILQSLQRRSQQGKRREVSVIGFLQRVQMEQKTCLLDIRDASGKRGVMYFKEGVLYDALCGPLGGEEAALEILAMPRAMITYGKLPKSRIARHIKKELTSLILNSARKDDERRANQKRLSVSEKRLNGMLDDAVYLCEGMHFKKANGLLVKALRKNPKNARGWFWLSRTLCSLDKIKIGLSNAHKLAPHEPEIQQEGFKVQWCSTNISGNRVQRCPFCWSPNDLKSIKCAYCRSYLVANAQTLPDFGKADENILKEAVSRYDRILAKELNHKLVYYSGLAYLNMGNMDVALECFERFSAIASEMEGGLRYKKHVNFLVDYIASQQIEAQPDEEKQDSVDVNVRGRKTILVVEDSSTTRKIIKMTLQNNGFHIVEAGDGVEALSKFAEVKPDLLLLDVMLPKVDGYDVLGIIKQNKKYKHVPVIMLTGKDGPMDKLKGKFSKCKAYITKPFKPEKLVYEVKKHIK